MAALLRPVLPRFRAARNAVSSTSQIISFRTIQTQTQLIGLRLSHFQSIRSSKPWLFTKIRSTTPKRSYFSRSNPRAANSRPSPDPTPHLGSPPQQLSLSQRLKDLSRKYGWTAVGVYLGLSVLDFPFCFLMVRYLGAERIGRWEAVIVDKFWEWVPFSRPEKKEEAELETIGATTDREGGNIDIANGGHHSEEIASLWTQLVLAYAVHKSLIVFRVPLTAAVLPKVVKTLRSWGWNIGKAKPA